MPSWDSSLTKLKSLFWPTLRNWSVLFSQEMMHRESWSGRGSNVEPCTLGSSPFPRSRHPSVCSAVVIFKEEESLYEFQWEQVLEDGVRKLTSSLCSEVNLCALGGWMKPVHFLSVPGLRLIGIQSQSSSVTPWMISLLFSDGHKIK